MPIGAAIGASAVIGGGAAIIGANKQAKSAEQAGAASQAQYDQTREDFAPWRAAGAEALGTLQKYGSEPGAFASAVQQDPGYQFGMDEGTRAVSSNAASRGLLQSGATLKALTRFGTDYATTKADNVWNRTAGIAGVGQAATGSTAAFGAQNASNVGNAYMAAGAARASGYGGVATAANTGIQNALLARNYGYY